MKILFTPSDNNMAGAFQSMARLCKILQDEYDCDVLVLLRTNGNGEKILDEYNIPYTRITSFNWIVPDHPSSYFRKIELVVRTLTKPFAEIYNKYAVEKISNLIKKENIDIVHLNTTYTYVPALAAIKCNIPFVWHLREFLEEDQHKKIWDRKLGYRLISKASAVVTISDSLFNKYSKLIPNSNLLRIYNGIDEDYYSDKEHKIFQNKEVSIVIIGTINESKGQIQAIQACEMLLKRNIKNFELIIVGKITRYANSLKEQAEKFGLSNYIQFVGLQRDTASFYKKADIALVCSRFEAFGRVTVEAMMGGCLVIGANSGGTVELVKDNVTGLLYKSGDINSLVDKMEYAITHPLEMINIAENGQKYMIENMTARKNAQRIFDLYQDILIN
ncbi:MAG: glycosyltransferase family 4 protein [Lachnospiraceae bacterium]